MRKRKYMRGPQYSVLLTTADIKYSFATHISQLDVAEGKSDKSCVSSNF